jgi:hypothetical protein
MCAPVSFVQGNNTSTPHLGGHFGDNLFRLGNVNKNQAGRGQIELLSRQSCSGGVSLANLHISYSSFGKKFSSELDGVIAQFDSNDGTCRTDAIRQQFQAALRTTADLDSSGSLRQSDLIKESGGFLCEFPGLLLEASLLDGAVAQKVLVVVCHRNLR